MAWEEGEKDEMGSLFEGMVLFNPSQMADDHGHHLNPPTDAPTTSSSSSQPLDENLFSDLTLITPLQTLPGLQPQPDPSPTTAAAAAVASSTTTTTTTTTATTTTTTTIISRQISRKKKRAGLRIGYGRDTPLPDDHPISDADSGSVPLSDISLPAEDTQSDLQCALRDSHPSPSPTAAAAIEFSLKDIIDSSQTSADNDAALQNYDNDLVSDAQAEEKVIHPTELKFGHIRAQVSEKLKHARALAASISGTRKDAIRRRRKAAHNLNLASIKYRELEQELEEACEAEDFEMAERVSNSLAAAEKDKDGLVNALRDAEADCDVIDSKMQEVLEWQIAAEEECVSLLQHFATDAANNADLVSKKAEVVSSKEMDNWISLTEALEVKKLELEIESHLITEARLVFNDSIEHSIEDDRREQELLCKKKDVLTGELEKLLALVKEKEEEIAENDSNIIAVEKRIADVVSGFQQMQSSIDANYDNLQSCLSQMELESEALSMKKKEIDNFLCLEEDKGAKLRELARVSADEARAYQEVVGLRKSLVLSTLKSREDKVRLAKTEEKLSEDVQMLRLDVSAARASLQELSSTKSNIQQEIASSKQRIFFIDKRVPELEAEKKVAAAARNFKEAARIAAEAKTLTVEKEGVQSKMEGAALELEKVEKEIEDTVIRLRETEGLILSKEKEVAMARCQRLLLIAGAATAERSAALELGDLEEANLLLAEAEAADSEAKRLQPIYNFKEEEFADLQKHFISMELVSNLGGKQLAELAASVL